MFGQTIQKQLKWYLGLIIMILGLPGYAFSLQYQIHGIKGKALQNVQDRLTVFKESLGQPFTQDKVNEFYEKAPSQIREALQPFGYFKAEVNERFVGRTGIFTITPGPRLHISKVSIKLTGPGKDNIELKKFVDYFPIKSDQPLSIKKYEDAKEKLFQIANEQGFVKAYLEKKQLRINLKTNSADIEWEFATGHQHFFGKIRFKSEAYSSEFLQRFVPFKPNQPLSTEQLTKFQQELSNSRYFQTVEVTPDFNDPETHSVPIDVTAIAPKSKRFDFGIGYATTTGPRVTLGGDFRHLTSTGHRFNTELKLSEVLSALNAKYYIPGNNPLTEQYTIGGNVQYFKPKNGTSFSQTITGSYINNSKEWQNTVSLNILNERFTVVNQSKHQSQVLYPSWSLTHVKTDDPLYPRFGHMFNVTVQGASTAVLSKSNFFQTEVKGKAVVSPTKHSRLIVRGDLGYTTVENLDQLPLTLRYFAGGIGSVRGYPYSSIGPGKYLQVASAEIQHRIFGNWNAALFYDIGRASNTFYPDHKYENRFKRGEGVGIVYRSPIGPIQLYAGRAMSRKKKPWAIDFSIGPEF